MAKVYIRCDALNRVNTIESESRISNLDEWILVDEGEGDKYENPRELYLGHHILVKPATMGDAGIPAYYYKFENGKIVERTAEEIQADIDAIPPPPPDPLQVTQKAATVMFRALAKADVITAADALDNAGMFALWADRVGSDTKVGEYLRHDDSLYRVKQAHKVQAHYPPSTATAALYGKVTMPGEIPDWTPGSWAKDVKVKHNGKTWLSMVDNNTWEPGAAGVYENIWKEVNKS